jgi:lysophospholipase L1-like esterase
MSITTGLTWIFIFVAIVFFILILKDKKTKVKKVIFFGDSITEFGTQPKGYISAIREMLHYQNIENLELINAGVSGDKVNDLLLRMHDVIAQSPDIIVLWIGVNDVWQTNNLFAEPDTAEFEKDYTTIVKALLAKNINLVLVTPAVIGEKNDNLNPLDESLQKHCEIIRSIADEFKLLLCDMHSLFHLYELKYNKANAIKGILTVDGVHLNDMGNRFAANEILKILKEM